MRSVVVAATFAVLVVAGPRVATAQDWTGFYAGGTIGGALQSEDDSERVGFDTNLDGTFGDIVRTAAGVDAFGPGFCGGLAVGPTAVAGCTDDEEGVDFGGRVGYDRQFGPLVLGALADVSRSDVTDSVTAFSVTPAFYSFTRKLNYVAGLRGRVGVGAGRVLLYGTGGAAVGDVEQRFTTSNGVNTFVPTDDDMGDADAGDSEQVWGYQAGGGLEIKVAERWSLTGEYLFSSLDNRDDSAIRARGPAPATNPFILTNPGGTDFRRSEAFEFQTVRVGLSYRF